MRPGDLVIYKNTERIPRPLVGVILEEVEGITGSASRYRWFNVLLMNRQKRLICDIYLRECDETR